MTHQPKCTAAVTGQHRSERARALCPACTPLPQPSSRSVATVAAAPPQVQPWPIQRLRARRGHDFYPPADSVPPLDSTADTPLEDTVIVAHYFVGGSDWWIVEADPATGQAFGYACLGGDDMGAEWGYISLTELEGLQVGPMNMVVERDLDWTPRPVKEVDLPGL